MDYYCFVFINESDARKVADYFRDVAVLCKKNPSIVCINLGKFSESKEVFTFIMDYCRDYDIFIKEQKTLKESECL